MTKDCFLENIKSESHLSVPINHLMRAVDTFLIMAAPTSTSHISGKRANKNNELALIFYEIKLFEAYLHSFHSKIIEFQSIVEDYVNNYKCSWISYASARRDATVEELGYDNSDYDENDELKEVTEQMLESYSVLNKMFGYNDIAFTTNPGCLFSSFTRCNLISGLSIKDMLEKMDKEVEIKVIDSDGEMHTTDENMIKQMKKNKRWETNCASNVIFSAAALFYAFVKTGENLPKNQDNKEYFLELMSLLDSLLNITFNVSKINFDMGNQLI